MRMSVVICAHTEDRWDDLRAAVKSVVEQTSPAEEIVVVIDHNPALLMRAHAGLEGARVVPNDHERGLGGARNSGIAQTSGDVLAFLDDDAVASPDWLRLLKEAYRDPRVLGAGGGIEAVWEGGRPAWFPEEFEWAVGCSYRGLPSEVRPVRNLIGCNMSYRRDALEEAGRFRLGYGCDETEFCIRLTRLRPDSLLLHIPQATVRHRVPRTRGTLRYLVTRAYFEGGSKAVVSRLAGAGPGLSSERAYTRHVLPSGVRAGIADFLTDRDVSGLQRAGAIVVGFASTVAGYVAGSVRLDEAAERRGWTGGRLTWGDAISGR